LAGAEPPKKFVADENFFLTQGITIKVAEQ